MKKPDTRYARSSDVSPAYQVVGNGGGPGEVLVSSTVKDLVAGSGFRFQERGMHELKGVSGAWNLYAVEKDKRHE